MSTGGELADPYTTYSIEISSSASKKSMGSGFLLQASNSVYVVTARHVLFHDIGANNWQLNCNEIKVDAFWPEGTNESRVEVIIDLNTVIKAGDLRFSTNHDIAMVRIEQSDNPTNKAFGVTTLPGVQIPSATKSLRLVPVEQVEKSYDASLVGEEIYIFGYPSSIGFGGYPQFDQTHPLMRKGIIAGLNPPRRTIIIDCPVYYGNSGGPVVMRKHEGPINRFIVVGIVIEFIPFQGKANVLDKLNTGYSVVESSETILSMVWR